MMRFLLSALFCVVPALGQAQEVLGRSMVEGRSITIFADGTWDYAEPADASCSVVARGVSFCGETLGWQPSPPGSPEITAAYRHDDRHYGQMIIEGVGEDDGLTAKAMRQIVVQNAASATGVPTSEIAVLDIYPTEVGGKEIETIVYALAFEGLRIVFANGISTAPQQTMQLMTYAIGTEFSETHRDLHEEFLSFIKLQE